MHRKLNKSRLASILNADCPILECTCVDDRILSPLECYLPFPILLTHRTFSTYSRSTPYGFLNLSATVTGISWCERCFALWKCICERCEHGAISQWGPLKDENCEAIISFLCSVEPPGRVGSGHLIQSFSSTVVNCTMHQHKSHLPVEEDGNNVGGGKGVSPVRRCVPLQETFLFICPLRTFAVCRNTATTGEPRSTLAVDMQGSREWIGQIRWTIEESDQCRKLRFCSRQLGNQRQLHICLDGRKKQFKARQEWKLALPTEVAEVSDKKNAAAGLDTVFT